MGETTDEIVSIREFARRLGYGSDNSIRKGIVAGRLVKSLVKDGGGKVTGIRFGAGEAEWKHNTNPAQQRNPPPGGDADPTGAFHDAKAAKSGAGGKVVDLATFRPDPHITPRKADPRVSSVADKYVGRDGGKPAREDGSKSARSTKTPEFSRFDAPGALDDIDPADPMGLPMAEVQRLKVLRQIRDMDREDAVARGELIPRAPVLSLVQTISRQFRDAVQRLPDKYAAQIASELGVTDLPKVHIALERYVRKVLEDVAKVKIEVTPK